MANDIPIDEMSKIVAILRPLASQDRLRAVKSAMMLLGESESGIASATESGSASENSDIEVVSLPQRARTWMKQNGISKADLDQVFHITSEHAEVIAPHMPGRSKKDQMYNAYILTGIGQLLMKGVVAFPDNAARGLCKSSGCYDDANHSAYLRDRGNEFSGTKDKGWILTAPGLKRAAELIKELSHNS